MSNLDLPSQFDTPDNSSAGLDAAVLIVRDALGHQVITAQSGQTVNFTAVQGQHYRLLSNTGDSEAPLLDNLISVRQGADLIVTYAQGAQVTINGYFDLCVPVTEEQPDELQCSATVAGDTEAGYVIRGAADSAGVGANSPQIVYTHGEEQELLALVNGNATDEILLTTYLAGIVEPAAAAAFGLPGILGGLGAAAAAAAGGGGSSEGGGTPSAPVANNPGEISAITGTLKQGETLTAGEIADVDGVLKADGTTSVDITYQWQADGTDIADATEKTYTLTQAQVGKVITVVATYTDGEGTKETVTSAKTIAVVNVNDLGQIGVITGIPTEGEEVTAGEIADVDGVLKADGTRVVVTYQWKANGEDIIGASEKKYTLTQANVGQQITVVAKYKDVLGEEEEVTSASKKILTPGEAIINAAQTNTAGETLTLKHLADMRVKSVTELGLKSIQSALDSALVDGAAVDTLDKLQGVVDSYLAILQKGQSETPIDLSVFKTHFTNVGVEKMGEFVGDHDNAALKMFIDAVKVLDVSEVDTVLELQRIAEAVKSVFLGAAKNFGEPSLEDLQTLGIEGVNEDNLASIQYQINNGSHPDKLFAVDMLQARIGSMVENFKGSITLLKSLAGGDLSDPVDIDLKVELFFNLINDSSIALPSISNLNPADLKVIIALLLTPNIKPDDVDTAAKIQSLIDGYKAIMNANNTDPLKEHYEAIGLEGVDTQAEVDLMGDVISKQLSELTELKGHYQTKLQALANAVQHVMDAAAGDTTALTVDDLKLLGVKDASDDNIDVILSAIKKTDDNGTQVDTLGELQKLVPNPTVSTSAASRLKMADLLANSDDDLFADLSDVVTSANVSDSNPEVYTSDNANATLWLTPEELPTSVI